MGEAIVVGVIVVSLWLAGFVWALQSEEFDD